MFYTTSSLDVFSLEKKNMFELVQSWVINCIYEMKRAIKNRGSKPDIILAIPKA